MGGKTHLLRTLQEIARQQGFATAYVDCRSGEAPFASLQETYRVVAVNLMPAGNAAVLSRRSGPEAIIEEAMVSVTSQKAKKRVADLVRDGHLATDYRNLATAYCRSIIQEQHEGTHGADLRALLRADQSTRVRITDLYRSHPSLPRPIGKLGRRNAASWLRSLGSLPMSLGYPGLVILFDETEQTHSVQRLSSRQSRVHANLRNFVDPWRWATSGMRDLLRGRRRVLETARLSSKRSVSASSGFIWERERPKPEAIWVDLDELTDPSPGTDVLRSPW